MRKDHLMLVTDAGTTLHLGWDYGAPYSLDPLNGVDVELQLAQGVGQTGTTVERQNVAGVYRELCVDFWSAHSEADARLFLAALPYFTKGTLYFGDKYFCRFVVSKTPYAAQVEPFCRMSTMLYCDKPYWYSLNEQTALLGGFTPAFRFPARYDGHRYSLRNEAGWINARNPGSLPVGFVLRLRADAPVTDPRLVDVVGGGTLGLCGYTLTPGEVVEFYRDTSDRLAVKSTRGDVETNLFAYLDEDSTLTELSPGDNLLKAEAASGAQQLICALSFYPIECGILPEVLS